MQGGRQQQQAWTRGRDRAGVRKQRTDARETARSNAREARQRAGVMWVKHAGERAYAGACAEMRAACVRGARMMQA